MDALAFLQSRSKAKKQPIYVTFGDEDFLRRRCREAIVRIVLGDSDPTYALSPFAGDSAEFHSIRDELDTLPFLAAARIVVVEQADDFISKHREALERYAAAPSKVGVLLLEARTFPETTRLAKALPDASKLACKAPPEQRLPEWCQAWMTAEYGKKLKPDAVGLLLERVGPAMGLLAVECEKLAIACGDRLEITAEDVDRLVARTRSANVFRILDAVGAGDAAGAFQILSELQAEGEEPLAVLGALTSQLRKLASAARYLEAGQAFGPALDAAGVPKWPQMRQSAEKQIKLIGRKRLLEMTAWLVEVNLGLKGGSPLPEWMQLEMLIVKLLKK